MSGQQHAPVALYPGKDPVPILQEAGWAPWQVWTGGKSRPHRDSIPDRPARSSVAIQTELPGPHNNNNNNNNNNNVRKIVKQEQSKIPQEGSACITEVKPKILSRTWAFGWIKFKCVT